MFVARQGADRPVHRPAAASPRLFGAAASLIVVLLWVYYSAQIFLSRRRVHLGLREDLRLDARPRRRAGGDRTRRRRHARPRRRRRPTAPCRHRDDRRAGAQPELPPSGNRAARRAGGGARWLGGAGVAVATGFALLRWSPRRRAGAPLR
ncbi:MAG: hypothetical protein MZW92_74880 [Comamonadaceae bacterium]|nr:hypothetical protein [Comamonadaceae bacterium]